MTTKNSPNNSKIKQFPTERTERIEQACDYVNSEEPIDIEAQRKAEKLLKYRYIETPNSLDKLQPRGKTTTVIPLIEAKINVRVKRRVYRVPDRIEKEPEAHGVVYDTQIISPDGEADNLDIHLSDMISQK